MPLKHLKKVVVRHVPCNGSRSARALLAQLMAPKARASNPDCVIKNEMRTSGDAYIDVTYKDDTSERILCAELSVQAVLQRIRAQTGEMETLAALKAAGLEGVQMHSDFGAGHGSQSRETGSQSKTLEDF
mmetsp:Transcript_20561/g.61876  ORF Transcript_20561/g.61876 Transcript_20561/m.61876 type:complete len:130 (-) Transcript_20561:2442-2831(-)